MVNIGKRKSEDDAFVATGDPADTVQAGLVGQHPESVIKDVPVEDRAGPASVQQQEVRPDEREEAVGKSALATPQVDPDDTAGGEE